MSRLSAAIIGVGFVGAQHLEAIRRLGSVDVATIAASTPGRAISMAASHGVPHAAESWEAAVNDPKVDVVHVCVPNDLHHAVARAALRAGKHVICEKPLALTLEQATDLVQEAAETDRVTVLCHNYRFFAMAAELRSQVQEGALGELHNVRGSYLQDWMLAATDTNWRIDPGRGGEARVIGDIGSHWVDLAEFVTGRQLESVMAQMGIVHARRPDYANRRTFAKAADQSREMAWHEVATEDQAALLLRFQGGLQGSLVLSQVAAGHKNRLELAIDGGDGSALWRQELPDELWIGRRDRPSEVLARDARLLSSSAARLARLPAGHNEGWADGLRNVLSVAYRAIAGEPAREDDIPLPTFADGLRHLGFVFASLRSAREERWVDVAELGAVLPAAVGEPVPQPVARQ